jgi:tetratricopeptide (TPR) repeat protein
MIRDLLEMLAGLERPPTAQEVAEALWLAESLPADRTAPLPPVPDHPQSPDEQPTSGSAQADSRPDAPDSEPNGYDPGRIIVRLPAGDDQSAEPVTGVPLRMPAVAALTDTQSIARALRPLRRRFPSSERSVLDEVATAAAIADEGLWSPRYRPAMDRWLGLTLVVDVSESMVIWRQAIAEFRTLLERLGAFHDLRTWSFDGDLGTAEIPSLAGESGGPGHRPRELIDPTGRRLILLISDCIGAAWRSGALARALEQWSDSSPVAVLQPLPERMWARSGHTFTPVSFRASRPGLATRKLIVDQRGATIPHNRAGCAIPVLEMDPHARWLGYWASLIAGQGRVPGVALYTGTLTSHGSPVSLVETAPSLLAADASEQMTALDRMLRFRSTASPAAYLLACYLAAAPLSLPVMRLVQRAMLPRSRPAHLAEVFLSGLLVRCSSEGDCEPQPGYEFRIGVRGHLLAGLPRSDTLRVVDEVSRFLAPRLGSPSGFPAMVEAGADGILSAGMPFATVTYTALRAVGGYYSEIADKLEPRLQFMDALNPRTATARTSPPSLAHKEIQTWPRGEHSDITDQPTTQAEGRLAHHPGENVTQPTSGPQRSHERRTGLPFGWETVPLRNPNFTGREELLLNLHSQLSNSITALVPQALHGLGGVGKTQLAVEYTYRFRADYDLVWWLPSEHSDQIKSSLVELARLMDLPTSQNSEQTAKTVLSALRRGEVYQRWLLIYDNAGFPEEVLPYLPHAAGNILITSLCQDWVEAANTIQIDVFTREESVDLIMRRGRGITQEDAHRLAERLGDLPLAVEQAVTWQRQTAMAVSEYISLLDQEQHRLLSAVRTIGHPQPVAEAWGVAFERLFKEDPAAAELLQLCAFFGPEQIYTQILHAGRRVPDVHEPLHQAMQDTITLHDAIRKIGRYGLASVEAEESLRIHRLVQAVLRERIPKKQQDYYRRLVHLVLAEANPGDPDDRTNWRMLARIDGHIVRSTGLIEGEGPEVRGVVLDLIRYRYVRGDYESSRELAARAISIWRDQYGDDDEFTLIAYYHQGNALRMLGRYQEAMEMHRATRERMMSLFEPDHEYILRVNNSYGADLRINGEYDEALRLDEENLAKYTAKFGDDDRNTLRCENNLAVDLRLKGDFQQARALDEKIVRMRIEKFGPSDQDTLYAQCMLARDARACGDYRVALALYRKVLPEFRDLLGDSHQDVLDVRLSYGITLYRMGLYEPARIEVEACLAAFRRFGPEHPGSIKSMTILANPLRLLGHRGEARDMAAEALERLTDLFGPDHVSVPLFANNLAIADRSIERFDIALASDQSTLLKIQEMRGERHPFTLSSTANLASSWYGVGNFTAARELSERALEVSRSVRGAHNPLTLLCACNLALDMRATNDEDAGLRLAAEAQAELASILGFENQLVRELAADQRYEFDIQPPEI